MPSDAWELMRSSALKVLRALQTLGKLSAQLGSDVNKHRSAQQTLILPHFCNMAMV